MMSYNYCREVEEILYRHPAVESVEVIGIPDKKYGEQVVAWIKLKPTIAHPTKEEIQEFCKEKVAHYKVRTTD